MRGTAFIRLKTVVPALGMAMIISNVAAEPREPSLQDDLIIGGTGSALGTMRKLADEFKKRQPRIQAKVLSSLGSGGGIKALLAGQLTVSVTSRPLTDVEQGKGIIATEIAKTPFVFAVSTKTAANNVTLDELAMLYSGKTPHWPDGTAVRPVLRPLTDVDTQVVMNLSPALAEAVNAAHQREGKNIAITDTDCADELEKISGAIGTSTLALIQSEKRRLKALSIEGVAPTIQNAVSRKYPYLKSIYLVTPANPSATAHAFARFIDSAAGRAILAQTGNLPSAGSR